MKRKNGFIISTMLYSSFGIMMIIVFYILYLLANNRIIVDSSVKEIKNELEKPVVIEKDNIYLNFIVSGNLRDNYGWTETEIDKKMSELTELLSDYNVISKYRYTDYVESEEKVSIYDYNGTGEDFSQKLLDNEDSDEITQYSYVGVLGDYVIVTREFSTTLDIREGIQYYSGTPEVKFINIYTGAAIDLIDYSDIYPVAGDASSREISVSIDEDNNYIAIYLSTSSDMFENAPGGGYYSASTSANIHVKYDPETLTLLMDTKHVVGYQQLPLGEGGSFGNLSTSWDEPVGNRISNLHHNAIENFTSEDYNTVSSAFTNKFTEAGIAPKEVRYQDNNWNTFSTNFEEPYYGILVPKMYDAKYPETTSMDIIWFKYVPGMNSELMVIDAVPDETEYKKTINIMISDNSNSDDIGVELSDEFINTLETYDITFTYFQDNAISSTIVSEKIDNKEIKVFYNDFNSFWDFIMDDVKTYLQPEQ